MENKINKETSSKINKGVNEGIKQKVDKSVVLRSKKKPSVCGSKSMMVEKLEGDRVEKILQKERGQKLHVGESYVETQTEISPKKTTLFVSNNVDRPVCDVIFCNLIAISAIVLAMFLPLVNFALPVLVFFYFEVGVAKYLLCKEHDGCCHYEQIFVPLKKYVKIFCLSIVKIFMVAFGFILFIVPGVISLLNHCFCPFVLAENDELDVKAVLMLSKELVYGFKWKIFLVGILSLLAIGAGATLMFLIVLLFDAFLFVPTYVYVVCVVFAGLFTLTVLSLPMLQIAITDNYIMAKQRKVRT